jgi:hypothetical protein
METCMETIVTRSWDDLNEVLYKGAWKENLQRFRSDYVYRGLPSARYDLQTSLMRLGGNYPKLEQHLLRAFRRYTYRYAALDDSVWNWLALAQHHGLPTRRDPHCRARRLSARYVEVHREYQRGQHRRHG